MGRHPVAGAGVGGGSLPRLNAEGFLAYPVRSGTVPARESVIDAAVSRLHSRADNMRIYSGTHLQLILDFLLLTVKLGSLGRQDSRILIVVIRTFFVVGLFSAGWLAVARSSASLSGAMSRPPALAKDAGTDQVVGDLASDLGDEILVAENGIYNVHATSASRRRRHRRCVLWRALSLMILTRVLTQHPILLPVIVRGIGKVRIILLDLLAIQSKVVQVLRGGLLVAVHLCRF